MSKTIEYRVRPVTRYIVTEFECAERESSCGEIGEFDSYGAAERAAETFARAAALDKTVPPVTQIIGHNGRVWAFDGDKWVEQHKGETS